MMLYDVKPIFQPLLRPCMFALAKKNITAIQVHGVTRLNDKPESFMLVMAARYVS
ncbi:MAG: hypothetical protein ACK5JN_12345 [Kluyvera sp.]|uniref:hypothetical protein n=1 Tax=Kluyvera sp. TaxID=1538228 RepID=UPI003A85284D